MGINKVILVGNVGKDPEIQYIKEDIPVARFTLATSETYRDKNGEKVKTTEWHNITAWRNTAKIIEQYVKKGDQLYIEGKISTRSYEKDGETKYFTEIVVNQLQMLGSKSSGQDNNTTTPKTDNKQQNKEQAQEQEVPEIMKIDEDDDLPF